MSTGTALVAFKQALRTELSIRPGLAGVAVLYGFPDTQMPAEALWFENAETESEIPLMRSGTKKVDETVDLDVVIQVLKQDGSDQEAADIRAAQILAELQQELAEAPQTVDVILWAEMVGWEHSTGLLPNGGHGARFEVTVRYKARLLP